MVSEFKITTHTGVIKIKVILEENLSWLLALCGQIFVTILLPTDTQLYEQMVASSDTWGDFHNNFVTDIQLFLNKS